MIDQVPSSIEVREPSASGLFDEEDIVCLEDVYGRASTGLDEGIPLIRQSSLSPEWGGLRSYE